MTLIERFVQLLIAVDQGFNVLIGSGYADETLSAFAHRKQGWRRHTINAIFFWQADHCFESWMSEKQRKQLPKEYQL